MDVAQQRRGVGAQVDYVDVQPRPGTAQRVRRRHASDIYKVAVAKVERRAVGQQLVEVADGEPSPAPCTSRR